MSANPSKYFYRAIRSDNLHETERLITVHGLFHSTAWSDGYKFLCCALRYKRDNIAKLLLNSGCTVNSGDEPSETPLHLAGESRNTEIISMLLDKNANVDAKDDSDYTPLHSAASANYTEMAAMLLNRNANVNARNNLGETPLHLSVDDEDASEIVTLLLTEKADVNAVDDKGETPLDRAVRIGNLKITELLLMNKADMNTISRDGMCPLHSAIVYKDAEIVQLLLNNGAFVDKRASPALRNSYTPLHFASEINNEEVVKWLLSKGANINARTSHNSTALHLAAKKNHDNVLKVLLEHGEADIDAKDKNDDTALDIAIETGNLSTVKIILEIRPDVNNANNRHCLRGAFYIRHNEEYRLQVIETLLLHGFTVQPVDASDRKILHGVVQIGHVKIFEKLLAYGADIESSHVDKEGYTLLHNAAESGRLDVAEILIKHGANVNAADENGKYPISYAIEKIDPDMTRLLVSSGAKIKYSHDLLHTAVSRRSKEIIEIMMEHDSGFEIDARGKYGNTALCCVVRSTYYGQCYHKREEKEEDYFEVQRDLVELFLSRGADVNASDRCSAQRVIHYAIERCRYDVMEVLLKYNADVNCIDGNFWKAPIHYAAIKGDEIITQMLLDKGADVNAKCRDGSTALHYACEHANGKVVAVLTEAFADVECRNREGQTVLHVASQKAWPKVVDELLNYGADINVICDNDCTPHSYAARAYLNYQSHRAELLAAYIDRFPYNFITDDYEHRHSDNENMEDERKRHRKYLDDYKRWNIHFEKTLEIFEKHIVKLTSLGLYVSGRNSAAKNFKKKLRNFHVNCKREVETMKRQRIGNTNISYYDILIKSIDHVSIFMRNESVEKVFDSSCYDQQFPIYNKMLYYKFKKGQKQKNLMYSSVKSLQLLSGFVLPVCVSFELLRYLGNKDLENLTSAGSDTIFSKNNA